MEWTFGWSDLLIKSMIMDQAFFFKFCQYPHHYVSLSEKIIVLLNLSGQNKDLKDTFNKISG